MSASHARLPHAARTLALVVFALVLSGRAARAQYPFVPPPVPCISRGEGPGMFAGIATNRALESPRRNLAVLQFTQISTGDDFDVAVTGLRDRLLARLRDARPIDLREYVGPAEIRSQVPEQRVVELMTVGKELNARHLLAGRVSQDGQNVEILLESFDALSGQRLWQATRTAPISDLVHLEVELGRLVAAHEFGVVSVADSLMLSHRTTDDGVAYAHYVRGVAYLADSARLRDAASELEAATQRAPKVAVALSALATAYTRRAAMLTTNANARDSLHRLAVIASDRAVALDPRGAHAWIAWGTVLAGGYPEQLSSARVAYEHARRLDPANAEAYRLLGHVLLLQGSAKLAQSHLLRAIELNPEDASPLLDLGALELNERAYGQSCRALDLAISINPRFAAAYELRAMARLHRGDVRPAWIDAETGRLLGADLAGQAVAAIVDVAAHDTVSARARIRALRKQMISRKSISVADGGFVALGLVAIGDRNGALEILERVRPRDAQLNVILHNPGFDPLGMDTRFRKLLEASGAGVTR